MSAITIYNHAKVYAAAGEVTYKGNAHITLTYWNIPVDEVDVAYDDSGTITTNTTATITAIAVESGTTQPSASITITASQATIVISTSADGSLQLTQEAAATDTITLSNQCPVPVQVFFQPASATAQTYMVPANEQLPIITSMQFEASGYYRCQGTDYTVKSISFSNPQLTLSVVNSENENHDFILVIGS